MDTGEQKHADGAKVVASLALGLGSFALGVLPAKAAEWWRSSSGGGDDHQQQQQPPRGRDLEDHHRHLAHHRAGGADCTAASLLAHFGGGVLFFTSLVHLMTEARESADALRRAGRLSGGFGEDLPDMVCCAGMFAAWAADEAAHAWLAWCDRRLAQRRSPNYRRTSDGSEVPPEADGPANGRAHGPLYGLFAVLALSFHELFEGLAMGLERREENVWGLLLAVASHKFVIAFCVGLELARSNVRRPVFYACVGTFAFVTPAGIACGAIVDRLDDRVTVGGLQGPVPVLLQAFAAGTLLYVVFFEILPKHCGPGWSRLLAFVSGFAVMMAVQNIAHNHSHTT